MTKYGKKVVDRGLAGRENAFGNIYNFLPRREDVTSRSSDSLANKRFVVSFKLLTCSIKIDHSLIDVTVFVILKIVFSSFQIYDFLEYKVRLMVHIFTYQCDSYLQPGLPFASGVPSLK